MRNLFLALTACVALVGCAQSAPPADMPYRDQRSVTTRPAPRGGQAADVLVRVQELQGPPMGTATIPTDLPPDAKVLSSVETLASFGTPFYCTVGLAEQRIELGGLIIRGDNNICRVTSDYRDHVKMGGTGVNSTN